MFGGDDADGTETEGGIFDRRNSPLWLILVVFAACGADVVSGTRDSLSEVLEFSV